MSVVLKFPGVIRTKMSTKAPWGGRAILKKKAEKHSSTQFGQAGKLQETILHPFLSLFFLS